MRIAMIHRDLAVPPRAGAHLHTTKIAAELQRRGHEIRYFCFELDQQAPLPFRVDRIQSAPEREADAWLGEGRLIRSLMRYWATTPGDILGLSRALERADCDVVIGSGLHGLFYLRQAPEKLRIWYAPDEIFTAALSQCRWTNGFVQNRMMLMQAARLLLFERMSRDIPDQTWVVAEKDLRAMRRILGERDVVKIANGVDLEFFSPGEGEAAPNTAVFWGRLDFGPNEQALDFFLGKVWPLVREAQPEAKLIVMGFSPSEAVRALVRAPGVELLADVPDLRPVVHAAPVAIYPFVSGTGIKNKLLEGAAMGRALAVSPRAVDGLQTSDPPPWRLCESPESWRDALLELWRNPARARTLGGAARRWVEANHSWESAGALAAEQLERVAARRRQAVP